MAEKLDGRRVRMDFRRREAQEARDQIQDAVPALVIYHDQIDPDVSDEIATAVRCALEAMGWLADVRVTIDATRDPNAMDGRGSE